MFKRFLSMLLCLSMVASMLPAQAFAADLPESETIPVETSAPETTEAPTEAPEIPETEAETAPAIQPTVPETTGETIVETIVETTEEPANDTPPVETDAITEAPAETQAPALPTVKTDTACVGADLPGNDELFEGYANQLFYGSGAATFGIAAGSTLTGVEKELYDLLVPILRDIASGERTSTVISMGRDVNTSSGLLEAEFPATFSGPYVDGMLTNVVHALLADLPYEMYWYDKTIGCNIQYTNLDPMTFILLSFTVAENYRGGNTYTTDPTLAKSAAAAAENARDIVTRYASGSDYEMLLGYRNEICALVSYDDDAATGNYFSTDNDPWQLIHVFDGDAATNVVCEGYAKAFMYLCDLSDFSGDTACYTVSGTMSGGNHMWNIVTLEGRNYLVDITNSDSGTVGQNGGLFLAGGPGSPTEGYTFLGYRFLYADSDKTLWGTDADSILNLTDANYDPNATHTHSYTAAVTAPTCTDQGYTTYTCSCGDSYIDHYIASLGHTWDDGVITLEPTEDTQGEKTYTCIRCLETYIEYLPTVVPSYPAISVGAVLRGSLAYGERTCFTFTVPEDGTYNLWNEFPYTIDGCWYWENSSHTASLGDQSAPFALEFAAGDVLTLELSNWGGDTEYAVHLERAPLPETIEFEYSSIQAVAGQTRYLYFQFGPEGAASNAITWTVDETIAELSVYQTSLEFRALKAGTTTLRATLPNGTYAECVITVSEPGIILCDDPQSPDLGEEEVAGYWFTAPETATYYFYNTYEAALSISLYDEVGYTDGSGSYCQKAMTAGERVLVVLHRYSTYGNVELVVTKAVAATGLTLEKTAFEGYVGSRLDINVLFQPFNAIQEEITWTMTDPTVASLDYHYDTNAQFTLTKAGTTTITATTPSGLSASCVLTVKEPQTIEAGFQETIFLETGSDAAFYFTPDADGEYVFWTTDGSYSNFEVYDADGSWLSGSNRRIQFRAIAGQKYLLIVNNYNDSDAFPLRLEKAVPLTGMTLTHTSYTGWVNEFLYMEVEEFLPGNGSCGEVVWSIEDPSVAEFAGLGSIHCEVKMVGPGTTKVTATCGNVSASCDLTVKVPTPIEAPYQQELTFEANETKGFRFTAPESGTYVFWDTTNFDPYIQIFEGDFIRNSANTRVQFDAEAGKTYTILAENIYNSAKQLKLHLDKAVPMEGLTLRPESKSGWVGQNLYLEAICTPLNANMDTLSWAVSDSNVLAAGFAYAYTADFEMIGAGQSTVTVTCGEFSASCPVTVQQPTEISAPYSETISIPLETEAGFLFTPTESGAYVFWEDSEAHPAISLHGEGGYLDSSDGRLQFYAEAGVTRLLVVENTWNDNGQFSLNLDKATTVETLDFYADVYNTQPGQIWMLAFSCTPGNADLSGITASISDESVAILDYLDCNALLVKMLKEGTTQVTITCGTASATCTVKVGGEDHTHEFELTVTAPTCTDQGYTTYTCKCGDSYVDDYVDALGHAWNEGIITTQPTEESEGVKAFDCTRCDATKTESIPKLEHVHAYTAAVTAPTCTEQGFTTYTCKCGDSYVDDYVDALGHAWNEGIITTQPTEEAEGVKTFTCSRCDATKTESIPKLDHVHAYTATVTAPTCTDQGYTTYTCKCGDTYVDAYVDALDHSWNEGVITIQPTEEAEGVKTFTCSRCDATKTESIPKLEHVHSYTSTVTAPTCTEQGYTTYTCKCGESYVDDYVDALGHSYGDWIETLAPTETSEGSEYRQCAVCGHTETRVIPQLQLQAPEISGDMDAATGAPVISWEAVPGAASYQIYRSTRRLSNFSQVASVDAGNAALSYRDTNVTPGQTYYYKLTAVNAAGEESEFSKTISRTCDLSQPLVSTSNIASSGKIKVSWEAIEDAEEYEVCRSEDNVDWDVLTTTSSTSYTDSSAESGMDYYYRVRALHSKSAAHSAYSEAQLATRKLKRPSITLDGSNATGLTTVSWSEIDGAASYGVYRSTEKDGDYTFLGNVSGTEFVDETAQAGMEYFYKVMAEAENAAASSALSTAKSRTTALARPVVTLSNVESSGKIKVSWEPLEGAVEYKVYRATSKSGTYSLVKTTSGTSYTNTSATAGKTYYYKVKAIAENEEADSAYSSVKSLTCDLKRPTVTLSKTASGSIKVSWKKITNAAKYSVYRSTDGETWKPVKTTTSLSYTNSSVEPGTTYFYRVKAIHEKSSANSAYSLVKEITCTLPAPELSISGSSATGKIKLSWEAIDDAIGYGICRSETEDGEYAQIDTTGEDTYTDETAVAGTKYYYHVIALAENADGNSEPSNVESRTCDLAKPVITLTAVEETGKTKVSWEAVEGAAEYKVYRATSKSGTYSLQKTVTETEYVDTKATAGKTYYYKVRAIHENSAANSAYSSIKSRTADLAQPQVTLTETSAGKPKLSWKKVSGAKEYKVYRSTDGEDWDLMKTTTSTSYTNTSVKEGTVYYYRVRAIHKSSSANSAYSEVLRFGEPEKAQEITLYAYPIGAWGDEATVSAMMAAFEEETGIHVNVEYATYMDGDAKLAAMVEAGEAPDLVLEGPERLVANWGERGYLVNLADMFDETDKSEIYDSVLDACFTDETTAYQYPLALTTHCMAINKTVFEAAGAMRYIDEVNHTWSTEDFLRCMELVYAYTEETVGSIYCGGMGGDQGTRALVTNFYGGSFTNADHTAYTWDSQENVSALETLHQLYTMDILEINSEISGGDEIALFYNGKLNMAFCWNVAQQMNPSAAGTGAGKTANGDEILFLSFPTPEGTKPQLQGGIWGFGIFDSGDDARTEAAKAFIRYFCDSEATAQAVRASSYFPVRDTAGKTDLSSIWSDNPVRQEYHVLSSLLGDYYQVAPNWSAARNNWFQLLQALPASDGTIEGIAAIAEQFNNAANDF